MSPSFASTSSVTSISITSPSSKSPASSQRSSKDISVFGSSTIFFTVFSTDISSSPDSKSK